MEGPERAAIRQIAHELLKSLVPGYTKSPTYPSDEMIMGGSVVLQGADATFSAALDLRTLTVDQTLDMASRTTPPQWTDPNPRVRIVWSGPMQKPARSIDAAQFVNGLSARSIQRESARIAKKTLKLLR